jgi:hypothetical protein
LAQQLEPGYYWACPPGEHEEPEIVEIRKYGNNTVILYCGRFEVIQPNECPNYKFFGPLITPALGVSYIEERCY